MLMARFGACLDHRAIRNTGPADLESCSGGKHRQEFSLSTAISFTEGMDEVYFGKHGPGFVTEGFQVTMEIAEKIRT